jgi:dTDP-glucose 4,6-dehydratase
MSVSVLDAAVRKFFRRHWSSPYQFAEKLIPLMSAQLLAGQPLPMYGDGRDIRDGLHAANHCRDIDAVGSGGRAGDVSNIGGRFGCENIHRVRLLCRLIDEQLATT